MNSELPKQPQTTGGMNTCRFDSIPILGNPKKEPTARRRRPDYPDTDVFEFVEFKIPRVIGPARSVFRYVAKRSDGATVTRRSPDQIQSIVNLARCRKVLREMNAAGRRVK